MALTEIRSNGEGENVHILHMLWKLKRDVNSCGGSEAKKSYNCIVGFLRCREEAKSIRDGKDYNRNRFGNRGIKYSF